MVQSRTILINKKSRRTNKEQKPRIEPGYIQRERDKGYNEFTEN